MFSWIKNKWNSFMNNEELKRKIYVIIFEADTPLGKAFDVALIVCIVLSVLIVIMESVISHKLVGLSMRIVEWVFTVFFTLEYLMRLYCAKNPRKYVFSFFGIIDLLATLPAYLGIFFAGAQSLMVIRVFRIIRIFRIFKLFSFLKEGQLLLRALYDSGRKIVVFFLFVLVLVISIGTVMYLVEGDVEGSSFNNIPNSI
ncbi:MAG: ion transporter, partial [Paludibacteraceae bacterium]|nr:ion transporter [Paludibacteraceae bacterium]